MKKYSLQSVSTLCCLTLLFFSTSCQPKARTFHEKIASRQSSRIQQKSGSITAADTTPTQAYKPALKTFHIMIDAGHGGKDPGAKSIVAPYLREKTLTLRTACKVEEFLKCWGYTTHMTRKRDVFIPLKERVALAEKHKCQLFVSIHYNSTPRPTKAQGIEIYYFGRTKEKEAPRIKHSKRLAQCILGRMVRTSRSKNRGVHAGDFCVIRETTMPAVLVEAGFLSNMDEARKLKNPNYVRFLAWSIAKGIDDFVHSTNSRRSD